MRDTIYRDDAIRVASGYCHPANVAKELAKLPSAQPEYKTGRWIPQDHNKVFGNITTCLYYYPVCSKCGHTGDFNMNYCPNCGAKMEVTNDGSVVDNIRSCFPDNDSMGD